LDKIFHKLNNTTLSHKEHKEKASHKEKATRNPASTSLQAFYWKLQNWLRELMQRNIVMLEKLSSVFEKTEERAENLKTSTGDHLQSRGI